MDVIGSLPLIGPLLTYILPFLVMLTIVVFVHEYGHYKVAQWCGVRSEAFSIGFGPEIFARTDSNGMRWKLCWIPLGGYVKFVGDRDVASATGQGGAPGSFPGAALWKRAAIVAAGPVFNFILAIVIFAGVAMIGGLPTNDPVLGTVEESSEAYAAGLRTGDLVLSVDGRSVESYSDVFLGLTEGEARPVTVQRGDERLTLDITMIRPPVVAAVRSGLAAERAGLRQGDRITAIDGAPVVTFVQILDAVNAAEGRPVDVTFERDGIETTVPLTPQITEFRGRISGELETRYLIGIENESRFGLNPSLTGRGPVEAVQYGARVTWLVIERSVLFIWDMIVGRGDTKELGGPIRIAEFSGDAAQQGLERFIELMGFLSASIGLLNLFPVPVLDGGHLMFYAVEAVRGKPLSARAQEIGATVGIALVLLLMAFATFNDVQRLFT